MQAFKITCILASVLFILTGFSYAQEAGEIINVYGKVKLERYGKWYRAKAGTKVYGGDVLAGTTEESRAVLLLEEGSTVTLAGKFQFVIEKVEKKKSTWRSAFEFFMGKARFVVSKIYRGLTGSYFEVKTPTTVTGVRGTEFALVVSQTGATEVYIFEGEVYVQGGAGFQKVLSAGEFLSINEMGAIEKAGELKKEEEEKLQQELIPEVEEEVPEEGEPHPQETGGGEVKEGAGGEEGVGGEGFIMPAEEKPGDVIPPVKLDPQELNGRIRFRFR